jgi:hypothetical protein
MSGARDHELARALVGELERALDQAPAHLGRPAARERLGQDRACLLLGVVAFPLVRADSERREQHARRAVEQLHERIEHAIEHAHRQRDGERDRLGARDRHDLGRLLADHDVEHGDEHERRADRDRMRSACGPRPERGEPRPDQAGEGGLADPSQRQRRERDTDLAGGEVGVELRQHLLGRDCRGPALLGELAHAPGPHLDESEFGGDEEAVDQDEQDRERQHGLREAARGDAGLAHAGGMRLDTVGGAAVEEGERLDERTILEQQPDAVVGPPSPAAGCRRRPRRDSGCGGSPRC